MNMMRVFLDYLVTFLQLTAHAKLLFLDYTNFIAIANVRRQYWFQKCLKDDSTTMASRLSNYLDSDHNIFVFFCLLSS